MRRTILELIINFPKFEGAIDPVERRQKPKKADKEWHKFPRSFKNAEYFATISWIVNDKDLELMVMVVKVRGCGSYERRAMCTTWVRLSMVDAFTVAICNFRPEYDMLVTVPLQRLQGTEYLNQS